MVLLQCPANLLLAGIPEKMDMIQ